MGIINSDIKVFISNRNHISGLFSNLTEDRFYKIPDGYKTNLLWNIGHLTSTSQILFYSLSGLTPLVSDEYLSQFRKGSSPANWRSQPDVKDTMRMFIDLAEKIKLDYDQGIFLDYKPYTTSAGITLENIQDAIAFNNYHDGIHTGIIQCMMKII